MGSNVYDFENRLVAAGGVSIVYDGDGNRVSETVAGVTTKYLVSEVNPTGYMQVLAELGPSGQLVRGYEWGLQLGRSETSLMAPSSGASATAQFVSSQTPPALSLTLTITTLLAA